VEVCVPKWETITSTLHYWQRIFANAFWDSLLFFFETRAGAWKAILLFVLGAATTTVIVWIIRDREALTEHVKANIGIAIAGGVCAWIIVFICHLIAEPFAEEKWLNAQLERSRELVVASGRKRVELPHEETTAQRAVTERVVTVKEPCELAPQINPPAPQACSPGASAPSSPVLSQETVQQVAAMRHEVAAVLNRKDTITFLASWPNNDVSNLVLVEGVLSEACRDTPRQCWFTQPVGGRNLDKPNPQNSGRRGVTVHGADADALAVALGRWFITYSTSTIPQNLNGYKYPETKELMWIEIGPGSPWKETR
jgi:hypothetical protein